MAPRVSFVVPTLNSARTLGECLDAILAQNRPRTEYEIVIADAGSSDATLEIARAKGVDQIVPNPLKTGEAGKAAGTAAARGELIALVDSDNILPDTDWLAKMMVPFEDPSIFASEPIAYSARPTDPALTRYFAALGMNDPICLFVGNYDRMSAVTGKWTGLDVPAEDKGGYLKLDLKGRVMPTIGANGTMFRRAILDQVTWQPYFFDIDVAAEGVAKGCGAIAKVKTSIIHLYCARLGDFARKQQRRIRDFLFFAKAKQRTYPWQAQRKTGIILFVLATIMVLPLLVQMLIMMIRPVPMSGQGPRREPGIPGGVSAKRGVLWPALYHVPVCWITLWVYAWGVLGKLIGITPTMVDRTKWQTR